jgi:hypothetical protein
MYYVNNAVKMDLFLKCLYFEAAIINTDSLIMVLEQDCTGLLTMESFTCV